MLGDEPGGQIVFGKPRCARSAERSAARVNYFDLKKEL